MISPNDTQKLIDDMKSCQIGFIASMKEIGVVQVNDVVLNALKRLYVTVAVDAETKSTDQDLASIVNARAALHEVLGELDAALPFFHGALKAAKTIPKNDDQIATCLNDLAELLRGQGKFEEAKPLHEQALSIRKHTFGDEHPKFRLRRGTSK